MQLLGLMTSKSFFFSSSNYFILLIERYLTRKIILFKNLKNEKRFSFHIPITLTALSSSTCTLRPFTRRCRSLEMFLFHWLCWCLNNSGLNFILFTCRIESLTKCEYLYFIFVQLKSFEVLLMVFASLTRLEKWFNDVLVSVTCNATCPANST